MAAGNTSISGLPLAGVLTGTELVPVVSNGVTSQTTVSSLRSNAVTPISALPLAGVLTGAELAAVVSNGVLSQTTVADIGSIAAASGANAPLTGFLTGNELVPITIGGLAFQTSVNAIRNLYITMGSILLDPNAGGAAMDLSTLSNPGVYTIMAEITIGQAVPVEIAYLSVVLGALSNHLPVAVIAATTTPSFHLSCVARVIGGTQYLRTFGLNNLAAVPLRFNYTVTFQPF